jgi:HlyD family secretion protein
VFTGATTQVPYFNDVRVTLDRLALKNVPKELHIIPGMAVEADLKVGDHTILDYIMERYMPIVTEGMREPN